MPKLNPVQKENRYLAIIERIFRDRYRKGSTEVPFNREDLVSTAAQLGIELPKNLGDVIYSVRFRIELPDFIKKTEPEGMSWVIEANGRSKYCFRLVRLSIIAPDTKLATISIPDSTPEIIRAYARSEEQALLAILRYNRLIDIFLGITTYSLQNHLRSTIASGSQIEIDELYVGIDKYGSHYVVPVQAKGGNDKSSVVQTKQDIQWCKENFTDIRCRAITTQFLKSDEVAIFEMVLQEGEVKVAEERHYKLVPANELDETAIRTYRMTA